MLKSMALSYEKLEITWNGIHKVLTHNMKTLNSNEIIRD